MKEVRTHKAATPQTGQYSARWYQAATLAERISFLRNTSRQSVPAQADMEKAAQRLKQWKNMLPFNQSEERFARRLALDGLTEEGLLALLAQPAEEVQALFPNPPAWLVELINAFEQPDASALENVPLDRLEDPHTRVICQAIKPLLANAFARLWRGIAEIQESYTPLPFDPQAVGLLLLPHLLNQILIKLTKTVVLELNVARVEERLQGETPEQRFDYFLEQLTLPGNMLALFEEYPVLARHLVERTEQWAICELELLQRLCADWDEISRIFSPAGDPGTLIGIQEGLGDVHQGGHSVAILTWSSGLRLVYKPRPLAMDAHFQELLTWLNMRGCQPSFRTFKLIYRETYGWCEFVSMQECTSKEEIGRFYQRVGGYLALLYSLEATDLHAQNLLASGEDPMLIDLESLFHPRVESNDGSNVFANEMFKYSVQRVGLLPERVWSAEGGTGIDLSALLGQSGQITPFAVPTLKGSGTDEMHMARERIEVDLGDGHRPVLQGQEVDTLEYEKNIITGFTTVYRLLLQHRDELLTTILPCFAHAEGRALVRQTQAYTMLQADSFHPNVLRDALERDRLFDRLWIGVEHYPYLPRLILGERADLMGDDTPKFNTFPYSRNLFTSQGAVVTDFFPESGMDLARRCIQHLDEQDLERQIWIIRASFASLTLNTAHTLPKGALQLLPTEESQVTDERLMNSALSLGDRLQQLAFTYEDMAGWMIMNIAGGQEWRPVAASLDLYSGLPGMAFFLAYLGKLSGEERYTSLARSALKMVQTLLVTIKQSGRRWPGIGAFAGIGSLLYLYSHLGSIWREPALYQEAEELVAQISDLLSQDELFDVMSGAAGCIAALLSLYAVAPSEPILAAAMQCGEHLLSHARSMSQGLGWCAPQQQVPLAGISHGNAGIALNLLRLSAVSKEDRFRQAALEALAYERSIFSPEQGNWPDLRDIPASSDASAEQTAEKQDPSYMTAWCHGAVGVGLARLGSLPYHDDAEIRQEIKVAVQTTLATGFGRNHSLCHGDMGSLELLLTAAQHLPGVYARKEVEPLQAALLASLETEAYRSGVPSGAETPSLMIGLAGTGYALLRQIAPEQVPSVLLLDPPIPL